jgi:CHAT domain-containing protein
LLLELKQLPAQWEQKSQVAQIELLLKQISARDFSSLPAISSIYARLNFANSLSQAARQKITPAADLSVLNLALSYSQEGLKIAKQLKDKRAESYAWGRLGRIYSQNQQLLLSRQCFEAALAAASSIQAADISYQWQQELGEIYQQLGNLEEATKAYEAAVGNLEQVRGNILATNPEIQFSFKEKVEPVYKKYLQLLLSANKPDLEQIIKINEQLQIAELENFLQCKQLDLVSLNKLPDIKESVAVIYIIDVGGRLEEIIRSGDGSLHRYSPNTEIVKSNAENVLGNFQDERFDFTAQSAIVEYSQALHKELIAPVQGYLPQSGTLVFVLDSSLQSLPMSLLHDGKEYLVQKYSISTTINSQLRAPKALKPEQMKALIAGLSKKSPSFNDIDALKNLPPLAQVEAEMADVKLNTASAVELVNEEFISENFYREIEQTNFSIVHVTSHGQFSSDPEQTAILAWDKPINIREFNNIVRKQTLSSQSGIELLVLSACQTAKGDRRSALGIAGIATTTGARSTLASLWLVEEASTAQLMGKFYGGLKNGLSKAEALQQAQLALLANPEYAHPYYWSSFILVGNWL